MRGGGETTAGRLGGHGAPLATRTSHAPSSSESLAAAAAFFEADVTGVPFFEADAAADPFFDADTGVGEAGVEGMECMW